MMNTSPRRCLSRLRRCQVLWLPIAGALLATTTLRAERVVFAPEAIVDAMHLTEQEFRLLNPGIDITGVGLTDEGFYIR